MGYLFLHVNELDLRHYMKCPGMETSGSNSFKGELGLLVGDDVYLFEVRDDFEVLGLLKICQTFQRMLCLI